MMKKCNSFKYIQLKILVFTKTVTLQTIKIMNYTILTC